MGMQISISIISWFTIIAGTLAIIRILAS